RSIQFGGASDKERFVEDYDTFSGLDVRVLDRTFGTSTTPSPLQQAGWRRRHTSTHFKGAYSLGVPPIRRDSWRIASRFQAWTSVFSTARSGLPRRHHPYSKLGGDADIPPPSSKEHTVWGCLR
ncbi:unnamed protein product, partial [Laminaria digitata]